MEMGSSSNSVILLTDTVTAFITAFFLFWTSKFLELTRVTQQQQQQQQTTLKTSERTKEVCMIYRSKD